MARFASAKLPRARIIRAPQVTKAYAEVRLCMPDGLAQHCDHKSERMAFQQTQELPWGERFNLGWSILFQNSIKKVLTIL
jgi:hypothetical protein